MSKQIEIRYGLLFPSIEEQIREQGFTLGEDSEKCENIRKSIYVLMFNNIATDSQLDMMFKKLHKRVIGNIKPFEEVEE